DVVSTAFFSYLIILWMVIAVWTGFDARKRYDSYLAGAFWAFILAVLNIPALIVYLTVRPDGFPQGASGSEMILPLWALQNGQRLVVSMEMQESQHRIFEKQMKVYR